MCSIHWVISVNISKVVTLQENPEVCKTCSHTFRRPFWTCVNFHQWSDLDIRFKTCHVVHGGNRARRQPGCSQCRCKTVSKQGTCGYITKCMPSCVQIAVIKTETLTVTVTLILTRLGPIVFYRAIFFGARRRRPVFDSDWHLAVSDCLIGLTDCHFVFIRFDVSSQTMM